MSNRATRMTIKTGMKTRISGDRQQRNRNQQHPSQQPGSLVTNNNGTETCYIHHNDQDWWDGDKDKNEHDYEDRSHGQNQYPS